MQACCTQSFGEDESCEWHDACSPISTLDPQLRQSDPISTSGKSGKTGGSYDYSGKSGKSCSSQTSSPTEDGLLNKSGKSGYTGKSGKSCSGGGGLSMTYESVYLFGKSGKSESQQYADGQQSDIIIEETKPDDSDRTEDDAGIAPGNETPAIPAETGGWLEHDYVTTLQNTPVLIQPLDNDNYIPQGEQYFFYIIFFFVCLFLKS